MSLKTNIHINCGSYRKQMIPDLEFVLNLNNLFRSHIKKSYCKDYSKLFDKLNLEDYFFFKLLIFAIITRRTY